jgi:hypothetical protein
MGTYLLTSNLDPILNNITTNKEVDYTPSLLPTERTIFGYTGTPISSLLSFNTVARG